MGERSSSRLHQARQAPHAAIQSHQQRNRGGRPDRPTQVHLLWGRQRGASTARCPTPLTADAQEVACCAR